LLEAVPFVGQPIHMVIPFKNQGAKSRLAVRPHTWGAASFCRLLCLWMFWMLFWAKDRADDPLPTGAELSQTLASDVEIQEVGAGSERCPQLPDIMHSSPGWPLDMLICYGRSGSFDGKKRSCGNSRLRGADVGSLPGARRRHQHDPHQEAPGFAPATRV